jgi:YfiH family protein
MKFAERLDKETILVTDGELKYVQFDSLLNYKSRLVHCFTTRIGGVSEGECSSLNLGFNKNDTRENVVENFRRLCKALGLNCESMVFSNQVHGNNIKIVTTKDRDKGFNKESDILGYDGLVTVDRGVTLVTFYADCVPVLLYEKNGKAAACVHSGWRSTLSCITSETVLVFQKDLGISPKDLVCVIGPCLGKCCFEVGRSVYDRFITKFRGNYYAPLENGKWIIDLREIIKTTAITAGVPEGSIHTSSICTKCRNDLFFSYRGDCRKTGSLAALMHLK